MKKVLMLVFAIMVGVTFAATGFAQRPGPDENSPPSERMEKEKPVKEMKAHNKTMKKKPKRMEKKHKEMKKEMKKEGPTHEPARE